MNHFYTWVIIVTILVLVFLNQYYHIIACNFSTPSESPSFRLMTYNAFGAYGDYGNEAVVNGFLTAIDSIHPDVMVLQEMHVGNAPKLCEELQKRYPYNSINELTECKPEEKDVACIFCKYPIKSISRLKNDIHYAISVFEKYAVPYNVREYGKPEIYNVVLDIKGKEVLFVCCYLKSNNFARYPKKNLKGFIEIIQKSYEGFMVGREIRYQDAKIIRDSIEHHNLPTIVCGDMNDFDCSRTIKTISGDNLKDVWWERGKGYGMTYYRHHLKIRIDHILTSKEFEAVDVSIPRLPFSDHYPIVADLKFAD